MFSLMMAEDRVSKKQRYNEIYEALEVLPGTLPSCIFHSSIL